MARNNMPGAAPGANAAAARPAVPGGATGSPLAARANEPAPPQVPAEKGPPPPPARVYRVMNGGTIMWRGCRTVMRAGKEVSEAQYDVTLLRRQGIRLEEVVPDQPAPVPEPAAHKRGDILIPGTPEADAVANELRRENAERAKSGQGPSAVPSPQFAADQKA